MLDVSSSFGQVPLSIFNEPLEGVVRSHCGPFGVYLTSPWKEKLDEIFSFKESEKDRKVNSRHFGYSLPVPDKAKRYPSRRFLQQRAIVL